MRILKNKLVILFIALTVIVIVLPLPLIFPATITDAEAALASSEELRNTSLWLFDNTFVPIVLLVVLITLFNLALKRRATVLKRTAKSITILMVLLANVFIVSASSINLDIAENSTRQTPLANKVIVVIMDGVRADVFWSTEHWITLNKHEGAWAKRFVGTYPTVTHPNIVSIASGTWPQIHGCELGPRYVKERNYLILRDYREPRAEDILKVADNYGILTVTIMASATLGTLIGDSNTTRLDGGESNTNIEKALRFITERRSEIEARGLLMFIHLVDSDEALHTFSSDSKEYRSAIAMEANLVGKLISNITAKGWADDTVVIVTADHGGIGYAHFNRYPPLVDDVPFWIWGGPIQSGAIISGGRTVDIAPTVAFILGIRKPKESVGVVLYRLFKSSLLENLRGISDLKSVVLKEYSDILRRAYIDVVLYLYGFMVIMFVLFLSTWGAILGLKVIRRLVRYSMPTSRRRPPRYPSYKKSKSASHQKSG